MKRLDVNTLHITSHATERFIERYRKKNPYTTKTEEAIISTMRAFINKSTLRRSWDVLTRPDIYKRRNYEHAKCYSHKGWIFVVGDGDGDGKRILVTCKRTKREQN